MNRSGNESRQKNPISRAISGRQIIIHKQLKLAHIHSIGQQGPIYIDVIRFKTPSKIIDI